MPTVLATQPGFDFKDGDSVIFEFEEGIITDIDERGGASFKLPYGTLGFNFLNEKNRVFPATPEGVGVAKVYKKLYDDFRTVAGISSLNWPGIHEYTVRLFNDTMHCLHYKTDVIMSTENSYAAARRFFHELSWQLRLLQEITVQEVPLLRR